MAYLTARLFGLWTGGAELVNPAISSEQAAQIASQAASQMLLPSGCLTTTLNGSTATYTLNGCKGPYALPILSGTVVAKYTAATVGDVVVELVKQELTSDGITISGIQAGAVAGPTSKRTITVGKNPILSSLRLTLFDRTIEQRGDDYYATYDEACVRLSGHFSSTCANCRLWQLTNYQRCGDVCSTVGEVL